jgi:hypothetical protein
VSPIREVGPPEGGRVSPGTGCVPVWSGQLSPNFPKQIGGVGRKTSQVGFYTQKKCVSFHSSPQKTRLRLFSEPGSGKSELGCETAIFFDRRTLRETGRIGSCGSRSDEAEASVDKTTPVPITSRGPVVTYGAQRGALFRQGARRAQFFDRCPRPG